MPLTLAQVGQINAVKRIGGKEEVRRFLNSLGFIEGSEVMLISQNQGNVIVKVKESRVAISKEMARKIMIYKGGDKMKTLKEIRVGDTVSVKKLHGEGAVKRRIMDMGITKGVEVYVRKVAPLGDPVEINVRGYELSLRKADAQMIEVE